MRRLDIRSRGRLLTLDTPLRERYARLRQPTPLTLHKEALKRLALCHNLFKTLAQGEDSLS